MERLFRPRSVAVIGASTDSAKIGYRVVENILSSGYRGAVHPVNPRGGELLGLPIHPSISEIEGEVDVAVVAIPAAGVLPVVTECGEKGVDHLIVLSSGFSEVGKIAEEKRIAEVAAGFGMRVLGPNVFGFYSAAGSIDATFGPGGIRPGRVGIISQSGALGIAMIGKTAAESLGLSALISVGNKADVDESDVLEYLASDEETAVVLLYIEGVKRGERLVETLSEITRRKPVVVIKSGRSKRGAMAAASHTGSLAGADDVFEDLMHQCGVLRARSVQEAFDWVGFIASSPVPPGTEAVIVTNGGGIGVLATDACEAFGVRLYDDQGVLREAFADVMPAFGSSKNPVDLTGQANASAYADALGRVLQENRMHAAIALYCETATSESERFESLLRDVYEQYRDRKPIVFSLFGGAATAGVIRALKGEGIPVYGDVYEAVSPLGALYRAWRRFGEPPDSPIDVDIDLDAARRILRVAGAEGRGFLLADEAARFAELIGLTMPEAGIARGLDEAVRAAESIGYPVVMKIVSKDIVHKSDAGGVALDLSDEGEVVDAYQAIIRSCRAHSPHAEIKGVEVAEMIRPGVETIVGARQDPSFGPVMMFGLGGIYVEVMRDVAFRKAPVGLKTANEMIAGIRSYPLLLGVRGERRKDIDELAGVIVRLSHLISNCREISDIEINPLVVYDRGEGVRAVDVRVLFDVQRG
ncbi:MAG: acetate--CoA ligase family protein [Candidatus Bipolaricaulia bacterium]